MQFQAATLDEAVAIDWLVALRYSWNLPVLKDIEGIQKAGCNVLAIISEVSFALHNQTQNLEQQIKDLSNRDILSNEDWAASFEEPEDNWMHQDNREILPAESAVLPAEELMEL